MFVFTMVWIVSWHEQMPMMSDILRIPEARHSVYMIMLQISYRHFDISHDHSGLDMRHDHMAISIPESREGQTSIIRSKVRLEIWDSERIGTSGQLQEPIVVLSNGDSLHMS